jgi:dephospho-CoA kinase
MLLAKRFRDLGYPVIESYPGAAQDIMRIPRKRQGLEYLEGGLAAFGVSGPYIKGGVSHDELDAITSAVVGVFFWAAMYERLGRDPLGDEALIIPDLRVDFEARRKRLVIGLSGPLGAGKTTAAKYFEQRGHAYCRYSEVIAKRVAERNATFTRKDLQTEGELVHRQFGQRWLGRELLRSVADNQLLVVDGVRFPADHAFLTEIFGAQFLHLHVVAPTPVRRSRFLLREGDSVDFDSQDHHAVEKETSRLYELAKDVVDNQGELEELFQKLDRIISRERSN